ncbi:MAG: ATP-dependent Clp protease ATP-binding subunit ClpX [Candidatus Makana argininalis]
MVDNNKKKNLLHCSFCNKNQKEVFEIISGKSSCICNNCVYLCNEIIEKNIKKNNDQINNFKIKKPYQIYNYLKKHVIGQKKAKKILSVAIYNHYKCLNKDYIINNNKIEKSNVLLIGPTGSGKTLLIEKLANFLDIPFSISDATTLTEAGYVGDDVESILNKLLQKCSYDIKKAEKGIIYIDEIDKISRKSFNPSITRDVSGEGVQQSLLKIIEGTISSVPIKGGRKHPLQEYLNIDTSKILFICGGSFSGINKLIENRIEINKGIGFNSIIKNSLNNNKKIKKKTNINSKDLIKFGFIPELVGRLPIIVQLNKLNEKELVKILYKPKNSIINQYKNLFKLENVNLEFQYESLIYIAKQTIKKKTGARGLRSILENMLLKTMFKIPSKKYIKKILIEENIFLNKSKPIIIYK